MRLFGLENRNTKQERESFVHGSGLGWLLLLTLLFANVRLYCGGRVE
jgi:hypothetical protein